MLDICFEYICWLKQKVNQELVNALQTENSQLKKDLADISKYLDYSEYHKSELIKKFKEYKLKNPSEEGTDVNIPIFGTLPKVGESSSNPLSKVGESSSNPLSKVHVDDNTPIKSSFMWPIDHLLELWSNLAPIQMYAIMHLISFSALINSTITLLSIYLGDYIIDRYNLAMNYPRIYKIIKFRSKFNKYLLYSNIIYIISIVIVEIVIALLIIFFP